MLRPPVVAKGEKMKTDTIKAIYDDDFEQILIKINELHDVKAGKRKCKICNSTITLNNIACIFPESGAVKYICSKEVCISCFNDKSRE